MGLSTSTEENNMKQSIKNKIILTLLFGVVTMAALTGENNMTQSIKPQKYFTVSSKIIVVIYHSGVTKWYRHDKENMESIILDFENIFDIQIIEKGE